MIPLEDRKVITINGNHSEARQRFTALHEIAHIVLALPSQHHDASTNLSDLASYSSKPKEERLCDTFAAECLLPHDQFKEDVGEADISLREIKRLSQKYKASVTSTGSRFALYSSIACAFVLIEHNKISHVSMSKAMKEYKCWIKHGITVPRGSIAEQIINDKNADQDCDEIPVDVWFTDGVKGFDTLTEDVMLLRDWNQCLSFIWLDENANPDAHDDEPILEELDGIPAFHR